MKKIAHFISSGGLFGAEMWIINFLKNISQFDVTLICPSTSDLTLLEEVKKLQIKTIILEHDKNFDLLGIRNKLVSLIKKEGFELLHTHGYKADIIGVMAARKAGINIISTCHGWCAKSDTLMVAFYEGLDKFFLRFFDLIFPVSSQMHKSFWYLPKKKVIGLNSFIALDNLPEPNNQSDPLLITYIGRLIELKRVRDIIDSLQYIDNVHLQIIGTGPTEEALKQQVKQLSLNDRVTFLGYREDRFELLNSSSMLILPSLTEGTPLVALEAMALGKLVIGTDAPGINTLITHNKTGLLVPVKSPREIAGAIKYALENEEKIEKVKKEALQMVNSQYSAGIQVKKYESYYHSLINRRLS